ncbi:glycosyltransferase family 2 protein [Arthrobacter sp. DNA4]|nr:glycosyltransferase family A protein [Arthrobacter sp. DNA4]UTT68796.1 glycosyltransferase family 2 protein [Arthrobacter sp. DNA4]
MAARDAASTIKASIDSILAQDYDGEVQLIVVDDASTDSTRCIVSEYPGVFLLVNEKQLGRSLSRNAALAHVRTDLVAIQDADDISRPHRLTLTVPLMRDKDRSIAGGQVEWTDPVRGSYQGGYWPTHADQTAKLLSQGRMPLAHPTMVLPTALMRSVGGYNHRYPVGEDLDLLLRIKRSFPDVEIRNSSASVSEYRRSQIDGLSYLVRSAFWRRQVLASSGGKSMTGHRFTWLAEPLRGFVRQRLKFVVGALRGYVNH